MSKRPNKLLVVLGVIVIIVGVGVGYFITQLDRIIANVIEERGSAATGTSVNVAGVSIKISDATGSISRLTIGNPDGFSGNAFELQDFNISMDPASLASDTVILENVEVRGARLNVLQQGVSNNLVMLQRNLSAASTDEASPDKTGKRVIINRFTLSDATAFVSVPQLEEVQELAIPTIVLTDIGRASNGATGAEATRQILAPIMERALREAASQSLQGEVEEKLDEAKEKLLDGLRDAIGDKVPQ